MSRVLVCIFCMFWLSGCAEAVSFTDAAGMAPVGFWHGFWHGFILLFAWIGSLVYDNVAIYAIYNNGREYDFGFVIGCAFMLGGGRYVYP